MNQSKEKLFYYLNRIIFVYYHIKNGRYSTSHNRNRSQSWQNA